MLLPLSICGRKMSISRLNCLEMPFYSKLIAEATCCCSSDRQSRSCGLLMKGLLPFHAFLGFVDSLKARRAKPAGLLRIGKAANP